VRSRSSLLDAAAIAAVHAAACVLVRWAGFDHVSDDDFARVTIAQTFAHAPKLDPSGTSWLPFPFWALGSAMMLAGRSLEVAHAFSIAIASAAAVLPYLALRRAGAGRPHALAAVGFALASPWSLWLGAATVPESMTASAVAACAIALSARGAGEHRAHRRTPSEASAPGVSSRGSRGAEPPERDGSTSEASASGVSSRWSREAEPPARDGGMSVPPHRRSHAEIVASSARRETAAVIAWSLALACACLSRYEAWPAAAVIAIAAAHRAYGESRRAPWAIAAVVCVAGPIAWMWWNAHAHDGPLHFFRRVSTFKQSIGAGSTSTLEAILFFPRLLATTRPDVVFATAFALPFLRRPDIRRRWQIPLACAAAELVFLAIGNARDGAPAHHSERALLGIVVLLALFSADVLAMIAQRRSSQARPPRRIALACVALTLAAWIVSLRPLFSPPNDDRTAQIARGHSLASSEHLVIEPCSFEHFALLAAYGAPERAEILPRTGAPPTPECPRVEAR
jgi:hypothetical protein